MQKCEHNNDHCDHNLLYLHPRCHIKSPMWVKLNQSTGMLIVECSACNKLVAEFDLSNEKPEG